MNKSISDGNISEMGIDITPPTFISVRNKRMREEDLPTEFSKFKEEMKELFQSFINTQQTELKKITSNLKEIQATNTSIQTSIAFLSKQNDDFQNKISQIELQIKKDKDYIIVLEDRIEDLQRCSRKNNIEIKNAPRKIQETREDLINMVLSPPIVVELDSSILKQDFLKNTKSYNIKNRTKLQAKHLGISSSEDVPVFISEQLTPKSARLFFLARDVAKSKQYKFCWTAFGRVFLKKDEDSKVILIRNEMQVQGLLQSA